MTDNAKLVFDPQVWLHEPEPEPFALSDGRVVLLRHPGVLDLVMGSGDVPDFIANEVLAGLQGKPAPKSEITDISDVASLRPFINRVALACLVKPVLVDKPTADLVPGETNRQIMGSQALAEIFNWALYANGEQPAAKNFLEEHPPDVVAVPAGEDVPDEAEPTAGNS